MYDIIEGHGESAVWAYEADGELCTGWLPLGVVSAEQRYQEDDIQHLVWLAQHPRRGPTPYSSLGISLDTKAPAKGLPGISKAEFKEIVIQRCSILSISETQLLEILSFEVFQQVSESVGECLLLG